MNHKSSGNEGVVQPLGVTSPKHRMSLVRNGHNTFGQHRQRAERRVDWSSVPARALITRCVGQSDLSIRGKSRGCLGEPAMG